MRRALALGLLILLAAAGCGKPAQPPDPAEFVLQKGGVLLDEASGLMWELKDKKSANALYNWHEARQYAKSLTLAGHDDWRLPTPKELARLFDHRWSPAMNPLLLPHPQVWVWSGKKAWFFPKAQYADFTTGEIKTAHLKTMLQVRAVRSAR